MALKDKTVPIVHLKYRKGDLIMKEGDYGISIYKIIKRHVRVSNEQGSTEISLATLGPGEIFGEMVFLNKATETRSASVRAMEDVELEVWHPATLTKEYEAMSPIMRYITNQTLNRLVRMNRMHAKLVKKKEQSGLDTRKDRGLARRQYYRKTVNLACTYRPQNAPDKVKLQGRIADISVGGAALDVTTGNTRGVPHNPGDTFNILTELPSGRALSLTGKVCSVNRNKAPGRLLVGLQFTDLDGETRKALGFFMMT